VAAQGSARRAFRGRRQVCPKVDTVSRIVRDVIMRDIGQVLTVSHMAFGVWIGDIVYAVSPI
jgi:hypothetical protein